MIYYIFFGISVFSLYYSDRQTVRDYSGKIFNKKNVFMLFSIIPLILLATFRDVSIGTDVKVYIAPTFDLACKAGSYSEFMRTQPYEFLYATINYLVAQISHNIQWLFCVLEIMMLLPTYYFICYHKKQRISVAISLFSFCFLYYAYTYNTVRQYMAMACIMIAYTFMDKRSYLKSYILILTAFGFHTSAFVCVVFPILHWLITNKKAHMYNKYLIISLVVAVYLIALNYAFFFRLIGTYLPFIPKRYLSNNYMFSNTVDIPYASLAVSLLAIFISMFIYIKSRSDDDLWLFFLCIMSFPGNIIAVHAVFVQRIFWYLQMYYIVVLGKGSSLFIKNSVYKYIYGASIFVIVFFYWLFTYVFGKAALIYPYRMMQ